MANENGSDAAPATQAPALASNAVSDALRARFGVEGAWSFGITFRARWSETDAYQHVSNRTHFVWFEETRNRYLEAAGYPLTGPDTPGPVIRETTCTYEQPISLGDEVLVTCRTAWVGRTSLRMDYAVWHGGLAATAHTIVVWYRNTTRERLPVPPALIAYMEKLDGTTRR
ncbi:thioesterase family protein [Cupriavidus sp. WS]|uniref:acyl-CoA thioesterase n=1 Tax=Cupriavidus sp. WS TaxID=1312922 RepID=UPI00038155BB|nr:thioesterase family protein [Cupriavidus sp. WS]